MGRRRTRSSLHRRLANMPIVRTDVCFRSHPSFFFITSERTFCAGGLNLTISACKGDSGSGLMIFDSVTGRYHLRGVVSRTLGNQLFCDQTNYIIFVDVFKYLSWINNTLEIIIQPPQNQSNPSPQNRPAEHEPSRPSQQAPQPTLQPITTSFDEIENYNECGISRRRSGRPNLLIADGKNTLPGEWPWVVAIFEYRVSHKYEYLCGGTILTAKRVLTAAHCLKTSQITNENISANMLLVALGRYKLMNFNEQGSVTMDVRRYIFHPELTHIVTSDSDLAILILMSPVEFTAFIRPICLLSLLADARRLEQTDGIIVGWGGDEYGNHYTEKPRLAIMPIVQSDICVSNNAAFANFPSERTFCAIRRNHSNGPCYDDSGNGLVVFDSVTDRYYLRGVVSRTLNYQPFCDREHYIVFVDVFKYLTWINLLMNST